MTTVCITLGESKFAQTVIFQKSIFCEEKAMRVKRQIFVFVVDVSVIYYFLTLSALGTCPNQTELKIWKGS